MTENISLIKEVHHFMSVKESAKLALEHLSLIGYEDLADKRVNNCSDLDIFYVKFIRALVSDEKNIIIPTPFRILQNTENIDKIINNLLKYDTDKRIEILDLVSNEHRYEGCSCNMIR
jgi:ABC-type nitrate/sulfonate/bicarbonate transport system ATPase subunit